MFNQTVFLRTMVLFLAAKSQDGNRENETPVSTLPPTQLQNDSLTTCYEPYGCFSIATPWTSIRRPISLFPESPSKINPQFCLLTRANNEMVKCDMLKDDRSKLYSSHFDPSRWTFFISHGYLDTMWKDWIYRLARALLDREDANVVLVNWSGGSGPPYSQAVANIRVTAAVTSRLIYHMHVYLGLSTSKLHLIGHSLGAHLSSYIGHTFIEKHGMKIARLTALDPAEPHFSKTHTDVRLDPSDADFVDVIHTDAVPFISGGLGLLDPVGHVDFYPNGGSHQPGCGEGVGKHILEAQGSFVLGLTKSLGCSHVRSTDYFIESLKPSKCPFLGFQCHSYENFEEGKCTVFKSIIEPNIKNPGPPVALPLGLDSIRLKTMGVRSGPVKLYLKTAALEPYCRSHYKLSLKISDGVQSQKSGGEIGMFFITVSGEDDDTSPMPLQKIDSYYEPGHVYSFVVNGETVGRIRSIQVLWKYHTYITNPLTWRFTLPKIQVAWIRVQHLEFADSILVCPQNDYISLSSGNPLTFNKTVENLKKC